MFVHRNGLSASRYVAGPDESLCRERWIRLRTSVGSRGSSNTGRENKQKQYCFFPSCLSLAQDSPHLTPGALPLQSHGSALVREVFMSCRNSLPLDPPFESKLTSGCGSRPKCKAHPAEPSRRDACPAVTGMRTAGSPARGADGCQLCQAQRPHVPARPRTAVPRKRRHAPCSLVDTQLLLFVLPPLSSKMKDTSHFVRKQ